MFTITSSMTKLNEFQSERINIYIYMKLILAWRLRAATEGPRERPRIRPTAP